MSLEESRSSIYEYESLLKIEIFPVKMLLGSSALKFVKVV